MELHKALKAAINKFGVEIIIKDILLNILDDYNVFPPKSPIKFILKSFISNGLTERILMIGDNKWEATELMHKFVQSTGFDYKLVSGVYLAIAYALDYVFVYSSEKEADEDQAALISYNLIPHNINNSNDKSIVYHPWLGYVYAKNHLIEITKSHLLNDDNVIFDCNVLDNELLLTFKIKESYYSFLNDDFFENGGQFMQRLTCEVYCDSHHKDVSGSSDDYNPKDVYISHRESKENDIEDIYQIQIARKISEVSAIRVCYY